MIIRQALTEAISALEEAKIPDPRTDAALLLSTVVGQPRMELLLRGNQGLTQEQEQRFSSLLLSRASRKPLQYILGTQYFYGLPFAVDERALIPRPETETLCELALSFLQKVPKPRVLDLGTGSGAIAVTIQHEYPRAEVTATDISLGALGLAEQNARRNQAAIRFLQGDLFGPVTGERFDCILSNPPYIQTSLCKSLQAEVLFEPILALDGGGDGLHFYRRIAEQAPVHLTPGGLLGLEIGDTQGEAVCALLARQNRFASITLHRDLNRAERVVLAQVASSPT